MPSISSALDARRPLFVANKQGDLIVGIRRCSMCTSHLSVTMSAYPVEPVSHMRASNAVLLQVAVPLGLIAWSPRACKIGGTIDLLVKGRAPRPALSMRPRRPTQGGGCVGRFRRFKPA